MTDDLISIKEIAKTHGKRRQSIHKLVKRLGIGTHKMKSRDARGQLASYITKEDYELLCNEMATIGAPDSERPDGHSPGVFYLIQLEPEHDPGRFKVGFASNIDERLRSHRTAAPFSVVIGTWQCRALWEKTAIECVTVNCTRLHTEVFRTDDLESVVRRCERFFALMPHDEEV